MPSNPVRKATSSVYPLRKHLQKEARQKLIEGGMPSHFAELSAYDLYSAFIQGIPDTKGNIAIGYGAAGGEFEGSLGLGDWKLSGLLNIKLSLNPQLEGQLKSPYFSVLLIHHAFPFKFHRGTGTKTKPVWLTNEPVNFVILKGISYYTVKVSGSFGLSSTNDDDDDADDKQEPLLKSSTYTELPLAFGFEPNIGGEYKYDYLYATVEQVDTFANFQDKNLRQKFEEALRDDENLLKQEVMKWIERYNKAVFAINKSAQPNAPISPQSQTILADIHARLEKQRNPSKASQLTAPAISVATSAVNAMSTLSSLGKMMYDFYTQSSADGTKSDELINQLDTIKKNVPPKQEIDDYYQKNFPNLTDERDMVSKAMEHISQQADILKHRLEQLSNSSTSTPPKGVTDRLSFLRMVSHEAKGHTGVNIDLPAIFKTEAKAQGSYKQSHYRFQTYAKPTGKNG